ncbi:hypothetical protein JXQ70_14840 [bacterium]|nr:hypothetical protein [bacterium]
MKTRHYHSYYLVWFVIIVQAIGAIIWTMTRTDLDQSLMERELVKPEWHAGKLGEAFANQVPNNGICHFYAFSCLDCTPPHSFQSWQDLTVEIALPESSYFLVLFEQCPTSEYSDGIRLSRNSEYPSGHLIFQNKQTISATPGNLAPESVPEHCVISMVRQNDILTVLVNDRELGVFQAEGFNGNVLPGFCAGPTGLTMKSLRINGRNDQSPVTLIEDFDQNHSLSSIMRVWVGHARWGLILVAFLGLVLIIARFQAGPFKPLILFLLTLSWLVWLVPLILDNKPVFYGSLGLQLLFLLAVWRYLLANKPIPLPECKHVKSSRTCVATLWLLTILSVIVLIFIVSRLPYLSKEDTPPPTISLKIPEKQKILLGNKLVLADQCAHFSWQSTINMRNNAITEFVFRKKKGVKSEKLTWLSLTLSTDPRHQSGLYVTCNNFQRLLEPLEPNIRPFQNIQVQIQAIGNTIEATIDNHTPITGRVDLITSGQVLLVPINKFLTLERTEFRSLSPPSPDSGRIEENLIALLALVGLQIFMVYQLRRRTGRYSNSQLVACHLVSLSPLWWSALQAFYHHDSALTFLFFGSTASFLLQALMIMLLTRTRTFLNALEIAILLVLIEISLQFSPPLEILKVNPIQAGLAEHLYWYKAASARRWNSFIDQQAFYDRVYSAQRDQDPPNKRTRILCLGSSSTSGGYPRYLEESLHDIGITDVEVIDSGIAGSTTTHISNFYTNLLLRFQPDLVTVCLMRNDMKFLAILAAQEMYRFETSSQGRDYRKANLYQHLNRCMLYRIFRIAVNALIPDKAINMIVRSTPYDEKLMRELALTQHIKNLENIISVAHKFRQKPVLLIEPYYLSDGLDTIPEERKTDAIKAYQELARLHHVPLIDLDHFIHTNRHDLLFIDDVHQNEFGKRRLAQYIARELQTVIMTDDNEQTPATSAQSHDDKTLIQSKPRQHQALSALQ